MAYPKKGVYGMPKQECVDGIRLCTQPPTFAHFTIHVFAIAYSRLCLCGKIHNTLSSLHVYSVFC